MTCTHPPYVLDSLERLSPPGTPRNSLWLSRCLSRERAFSRRPNRFGLIFYAALRTRCPRAFVLAASGHEPRPIRPEAHRWDETSDTSVANPSSSSRSRHLRAWSRVSPRALMVSDDAWRSEE